MFLSMCVSQELYQIVIVQGRQLIFTITCIIVLSVTIFIYKWDLWSSQGESDFSRPYMAQTGMIYNLLFVSTTGVPLYLLPGENYCRVGNGEVASFFWSLE